MSFTLNLGLRASIAVLFPQKKWSLIYFFYKAFLSHHEVLHGALLVLEGSLQVLPYRLQIPPEGGSEDVLL